MSDFTFPSHFLWGTATSSHQVEGHNTNNDWWAAEQEGQTVYQGQRSGAACDWWNNAEDDFDRMIEMNLNTHRLSIEWSRVQPAPRRWDEAALARYRHMISALKARGIEPMVTLHHFTNPLWMVRQGGWESEHSIEWFVRYVKKVVGALKDQVSLWCTINEPNVMVGQGWLAGIWPPGKQDHMAAIEASLNLARAHAAAYHAIHEIIPEAQVGIAKHIVTWDPRLAWLPTDHAVARLINYVTNHLFLDAITQGKVKLPFLRPIPIKGGQNSLDWLGINYYQRYRVGFTIKHALRLLFPQIASDWFYQGTKPGHPKGPSGWGEFHPPGLLWTLENLSRYGVPIYVTENGIPSNRDELRQSFLVSHIHQIWKAIQRGVSVKGYYHWSLLDNFEWAQGYNPEFKFGLIGVNFETQAREPRPSSSLYGRICKMNAISAETATTFTPQLLSKLFHG
ncbi:MAG: glycoside hydrolase family 1 protein [Chloroflexi bacterium]|nr:glycoside hydrolase family 1 protein [Chloroflexota bacterium]